VRYFIKAIGYTAVAANREGKLFRWERIDVHAAAASIESDVSVYQRENGVIAAETDISSGKKLRPALAHDDIASQNHLAAKSFYAEPFADAVAAVLNAALSFFVSH